MNDQAPDQCVSAAMLTTYAATVWMINGIHSRPDTHPGGRACRAVAVPKYADYSHEDLISLGYNENAAAHVTDDDTATFSPYGVIFMRRIYFPPEANTVRLAVGARLSLDHYEYVFNKTLPELRRMFGATGITRRRDLPRTRFRMNKGMSRPRTGPSTIDVPPNFFGLDAVEEVITQETGPDVDAAAHVLEAAPQKTVEQKALDLWQQFPSCVLQKIGNPKDWAFSSYCRLSQTERRVAGIEKMKTTNLAVVFARVQVKAATKQEWQDAFNAIFPPKGHNLPPSAQCWPYMMYYQDWKLLLASLNETNAREVRKVIWKEFKKLTWVPNATNDRPWRSNRMDAPWAQYPEPGSDPEDPFTSDGIPGPQVLWTPWLEDPLVWNADVPVIARNVQQAAANPRRAPANEPGTPGSPRVEREMTPGNEAGRQPSPDFGGFEDRPGAADGTPGRPRVEEARQHESRGGHENAGRQPSPDFEGFEDRPGAADGTPGRPRVEEARQHESRGGRENAGHPSRPSVGRGLRGASVRSDRGEGPSRLAPTTANGQRQRRPQRQNLDKGKEKAHGGGRRPYPHDKPFTLEALEAFAATTDEEDVGAPTSKPGTSSLPAKRPAAERYVLSLDNVPTFDTDSEDDPFAEEMKEVMRKRAANAARGSPPAKRSRPGYYVPSLDDLPTFDTDSEDDPFAEEMKEVMRKQAAKPVKGKGKGKARAVAPKRGTKSKVLKRKASVDESDEEEGSMEHEGSADDEDRPKRKRTRM
ncbi:hypothetical protein EYR36_010682 [Pleurotus pulmonarius]|nr:hypothetical protein EYR36_010682 [Pleurotus pulmonarius]KAF4590587.1 hypothetical protein EYR38_009889 [Pleurotus pulmonarius]